MPHKLLGPSGLFYWSHKICKRFEIT